MTKNSSPGIIAIGTAVPDVSIDQNQAYELLNINYSSILTDRHNHILKKILSHDSMSRRHIAVNKAENLERILTENHDEKNSRFLEWAVKLSIEAIENALEKSGICRSSITDLIVNTCTGYHCPGLSTYIIENMELNRNVSYYDLVGGGCAGAIPNLQLAEKIVRSDTDSIVISVAVEICSTTFQMGNDINLIVSNSLFGDGAAAAVIAGKGRRVGMLGTRSLLFPEHRDKVQFIYKNGYLYNQLSRKLPDIIAVELKRLTEDFFYSFNLSRSDMSHWIIHPGGAKILDGIEKELNLSKHDMVLSRKILHDYGNLSSPSVLFILNKIMDSSNQIDNEYGLMTAFGAGCVIYCSLLEFYLE